MWSLEDIENLVIEVAGRELNDSALAELVYALKVAQKDAPGRVAAAIVESPRFWEQDNPFSPRLAFGVVHHGYFFLDADIRETIFKLYTRQVNRVRLCIEQLEAQQDFRCDGPKEAMSRYNDYFQKFNFATTGFFGLAEQTVTKAVIGAVLENIIEATSLHDELVARLLKRVKRQLKFQQVQLLAQRVQEGIEEGFTNPPLEEQELLQLEQDMDSVRFRKTLTSSEEFVSSAKTLGTITKEVCKG